MKRCEECGSWDRECASPTPVFGCACMRCANHRVLTLTQAMEAAASMAGKDWLICQLALSEALSGEKGKHLEYILEEYSKLKSGEVSK